MTRPTFQPENSAGELISMKHRLIVLALTVVFAAYSSNAAVFARRGELNAWLRFLRSRPCGADASCHAS